MSLRPTRFDLLSSPIRRGVSLVEASAGTGKTHSLAGLVLRMLLEGVAQDITRILVVTFTNAATAELINRIRGRLREAVEVMSGRAQGDEFLSALRDRYGHAGAKLLDDRGLKLFDRVSICTIHSFCKRMLEQAAFEAGMPFDLDFVQDETELVEQAAQDFWRRRCVCDPFVARLAVAREWKLAAFITFYGKWRRCQGATLRPDDGDMDAVARRLQDAICEVGERLDPPGLERALAGANWNKGAVLNEETRQATFEAIRRCVAGDLVTGLDAVTSCGRNAVRGVTNKNWLKKQPQTWPDHPFFEACERVGGILTDLDAVLRVAFVREVDEGFRRLKTARRVLTFDDLLHRLRDALRDRACADRVVAAARNQYQAALIDEFQDTDPVQCDIFSTVFQGMPLFLIGDPKQAIYGFRGADLFAYLNARDQATRAFSLDRNWRSERGMVEAVNALFRGPEHPFLLDDIPFPPAEAAGSADEQPLSGDDGPPLQWWFLPLKADTTGKMVPWTKAEAEEAIREEVAGEVVRLFSGAMRVGDRPLGPGDIAVLVDTNYQAAAFQDRLRRAGVPSVISRTGDILQSREMIELERILAAVVGPGDAYAVRAALATELWGLRADEIYAVSNSETEWGRLVDSLAGLLDTWREQGFMPMAERLFAERDLRRRLLGYEDGERRLTNLVQAAEVLQQASNEERLSPEGCLQWLARGRSRPPTDAERFEMRLETDADAVKISTVHSCKGLQYGIVFCPFLWDSRDPDKKKECGVLAHTPQGALLDHAQTTEPAHAAQAAREELAERVRRAYVALTRARHRAYVAWGAIGQKSSGAALSALGYLLQTEAVEAGIGDEGNVADFMSAVEPTIGRLVNEHPRLMSLKVLSGEETAGVWRPAAQTAADLTARVFLAGGEERLEPWRMVSYSSLSRARWIEAETPEHADPPLREAAARAATGILAFGQGPRGRALGARTGNCLHAMLERLDFSNPDCPATAALVDEALRNHGLDDPAAHGEGIRPAEVARDMLRAVANNHLPAVTPTFRLSDVAAAQRVTEWPFYLPLDSLRPRDLAGIFRRHAAGAVREEYAPTLRRLTAKRVRGFLTGFVDLVFEHNGRWYVMDWKSNHLGDTADDYAAGPVWRAMVEHHYVLQYHLYVAALDRFLGLRQPRYEYERCFGGVWYVFLRGVDGRSDRGWRYDRPPAALISALGDALHRRAEA